MTSNDIKNELLKGIEEAKKSNDIVELKEMRRNALSYYNKSVLSEIEYAEVVSYSMSK